MIIFFDQQLIVNMNIFVIQTIQQYWSVTKIQREKKNHVMIRIRSIYSVFVWHFVEFRFEIDEVLFPDGLSSVWKIDGISKPKINGES